MHIKVGDTSANGNDIFKLVWRGWFFGVLVIFLPFFALASLVALLGDGGDAKWQMVFSVFLLPLIAAMQGVFAGGLVLLGLKIRPPKE